MMVNYEKIKPITIIFSRIKTKKIRNLTSCKSQLPKMLEASPLNKFNSHKWWVVFLFNLKEMLTGALIKITIATTAIRSELYNR